MYNMIKIKLNHLFNNIANKQIITTFYRIINSVSFDYMLRVQSQRTHCEVRSELKPAVEKGAVDIGALPVRLG